MNYLKILIFYILIFGFVHNISSDKPYNIHLNKDINADKLNYLKTDVVENEYIVMFHEYIPIKDHREYLQSIIGSKYWVLIENRNRLIEKSDFSVIKVDKEYEKVILDTLSNHKLIKSFSNQKRFYNSFKSYIPHYFDIDMRREYNITYDDSLDNIQFEENIQRSILNIEKPREAKSYFPNEIFDKGITGKGIKVGVFDTGISYKHPHFKNIVFTSDWTNENSKDDIIGHGTFISSIIAGNGACKGIAPDVELYMFKLFTSQRMTLTSWFLDAFNFALMKKLNILNLSIGGPDFLDKPFVDKIMEMSANNIIIVSAIGNDGPVFGSTNNPADQMDVIGVGAIDSKDKLAPFSSRGMTTWEIQWGLGRVKPDIVTYGVNLYGSSIQYGCRTLSGTSVAAPIVTGAIALLSSSIDSDKRWNIINPASVKQLILEGADDIQLSLFEQGAGRLNMMKSYSLLSKYTPKITVFPSKLDFSKCPQMFPYCAQPFYYSSMTTSFNLTILNGISVFGIIDEQPTWIPSPGYEDLVNITFGYSNVIWPWTGWLSIHIDVSSHAFNFRGIVNGNVKVTVKIPPFPGQNETRNEIVYIPIKIPIIPTPPRERRILWDQFHNIYYPNAYVPRDSLVSKQPFDWNGDHIYTNFISFFSILREMGMFVEILNKPYTCFNAENYGTLFIVDTEDAFFEEEVGKLNEDILEKNLSIVVFADWYDEYIINASKFYDESSKQMRIPITGGSNIPSLNQLLMPYNISFGGSVFDGNATIGKQLIQISSGIGISRFPKGGTMISFKLINQTHKIITKVEKYEEIPFLGFYQTSNKDRNGGRIVVFGDSSCIDDSLQHLHAKNCFWLAEIILKYPLLSEISYPFNQIKPLKEEYIGNVSQFTYETNHLKKFSKVIGKSPKCDHYPYNIANEYSNIYNNISFKEGSGMILKDLKPKKEKTVEILFIYGFILIFTFVLIFMIKKRNDIIINSNIYRIYDNNV